MKTHIFLHNRQRTHALGLEHLRLQAARVLTLLEKQWPQQLVETHIYFISEKKMCQLHKAFCNDPAPTDVITFHHGEIFICPAVAQRQRRAEKLSFADEILTYVIHGMLHLCGWNDLTDADFKKMRKRQHQILKLLEGV